MSKRKRISVKEFEKLLAKADAISIDGGALLTSWYTGPYSLLEAKESTYDGELWECDIDRDAVEIYVRDPEDPDNEPTDKGVFIFYDEFSKEKIAEVNLYKLCPIVYRKKHK